MFALVTAALLASTAARAASPEIRTSTRNEVPACVTPARLMAFLKAGNTRLDARYRDIAHWYERHGTAWHIRWDYAFFQMALETNFLSYRRGDGSPGDVRASQNNFAGLGATGGGVPGESFPDVATGVLAQIQHLVAYSGERVADPVADRTRSKQDDIVESSQRLKRPVRFSDLTNRWAADRAYHRSIEAIADRFRSAHCRLDSATASPAPAPATRPSPLPVRPSPVRTVWQRGDTPPLPERPPRTTNSREPGNREELASGAEAIAPTILVPPTPASARPPTAAPPVALDQPDVIGERLSGLAAVASQLVKPETHAATPSRVACEVGTAEYGGDKGVLVRAIEAGRVRYWALGVLAGSERAMAETFIARQTHNGTIVAAFESTEAALERARQLCADGDRASRSRTASIASDIPTGDD